MHYNGGDGPLEEHKREHDSMKTELAELRGLVLIELETVNENMEARKREARLIQLGLERIETKLGTVDACVTLLVAKDAAREREIAREHRFTDLELNKVRSEMADLAQRLDETAETTQKRLALTSQHEIDRIMHVADKEHEKLERKADRLEDKLEDVAEDVAEEVAKPAKRQDVSFKKWQLVAGIVAVAITTLGNVIGYVYMATHPPAPSSPQH